MLRAYRQAQQRTVDKLPAADRLRYAFPELTQRQVEVAVWIAEGNSNEAIANAMNVSLDTVKAHLKAIFSKIGTDSRLALAKLVHTVPPSRRCRRFGSCRWRPGRRRAHHDCFSRL